VVVAFTAVDAFAGVVAAAGPGDGLRAAHRLGVDQRRSRLPVPVLDVLADLFTQVVCIRFRVPSAVQVLK
jgi:hypothetical protein